MPRAPRDHQLQPDGQKDGVESFDTLKTYINATRLDIDSTSHYLFSTYLLEKLGSGSKVMVGHTPGLAGFKMQHVFTVKCISPSNTTHSWDGNKVLAVK